MAAPPEGDIRQRHTVRIDPKGMSSKAQPNLQLATAFKRPVAPIEASTWQPVYCWTHILRRRFVKRAENEGAPIAEEMLRRIALLYRAILDGHPETRIEDHMP